MATEAKLIGDFKIVCLTMSILLSAGDAQTLVVKARGGEGNKDVLLPSSKSQSWSRSAGSRSAQQVSSSNSGFSQETAAMTGVDSDLALYLSDYYATSKRLANAATAVSVSPPIMTDWVELYAKRHQDSQTQYEQRCVPLPSDMALCSGMNYNHMRLPNELGHSSLDEVRQHSLAWLPLVNVHCHPDTRLFFCSLFAPACHITDRGQGLGQGRSSWSPVATVLPCRSLCQAVRDGCERTMQRYDFSWPPVFDCQRFPAQHNGLCIEPQYNSSRPESNSCVLCKRQPDTVESIIDQYCTADFVIRVHIVTNKTIFTDGRLEARSRKKVYKGNLTRTELRRGQFVVEQPAACRCRLLGRHSQSHNRRYVIMGSRASSGRLNVTFLKPVGGGIKSLQLNRALRLIRNTPDICTSSSSLKLVTRDRTLSNLNKRSKTRGKGDKTTTKTVEKLSSNHPHGLAEQQE